MSDSQLLAYSIGGIVAFTLLGPLVLVCALWIKEKLFERKAYAGLAERTAALKARKTERIKSTHRKRPY